MEWNTITTNIILYCKKWNETVQFYKEYLELPVNFSPDWFVEFCLTESSRLSIADEKRSSIKSSKKKGVTIAFQVEDIDTAWKLAKQNGISPTAIKIHPWNARVFYLFDPEGHRIEIW